jgi:hypothetical protein
MIIETSGTVSFGRLHQFCEERSMHRAVSLIFSICLVLLPAIAVAQMQAGSTGGTIGKQDKSISGEDHSAPPAQKSKRSARTGDEDKKTSTKNDATGGQTAASLRGYWSIQVNCGSKQNVLERGGKWSFEIKAISGNTFTGGFDKGGRIVEGRMEGNAISLTTQDIFSRQWTGTVSGSRMQGSVTGPPDGCTFTASKG